MAYEGLTDRLLGVPGCWTIQSCRNEDCGLAWLDPQPDKRTLASAYGTGYYTHRSGDGDEAQPPAGAARARRAMRRVYERLLDSTLLAGERQGARCMYLEDLAPGRLLDVGCGDGTFLRRMRGRGWAVKGVETDAAAASVATTDPEISVFVGELHGAGLPSGHFDAVTLSHVVEHVREPVALLRECARVLRPGGRLVVVTPNVRSLGHALFGRHWRGLEPPRHLFLFSPGSLMRTARAAGVGPSKAWTTMAMAEAVFRGSLDVWWGRAPVATRVSRISGAVAVLLQVVAGGYSRVQAGAGEEVVLVGTTRDNG